MRTFGKSFCFKIDPATLLSDINTESKTILTEDKLLTIVNLIPTDWLVWNDTEEGPEEIRDVYLQFLLARLSYADMFTKEA